MLGVTQDNGSHETFDAVNWNAVYGGDGGEVAFNPYNSNFILGETQSGGIFRTTNDGLSWEPARNGLDLSEGVAWVAPIIAHPNISGTFYTARRKVYQTTNNGARWVPLTPTPLATWAITELAISKTNPMLMFATFNDSVYRSTNGGVNWSNITISSGFPHRIITSVYVAPQNANEICITFSGFGTGKVFRSTNGGNSWTDISGNLPDSPVSDILIPPWSSGFSYFVATDVGVFSTNDGGVNWVPVNEGLPNTVVLHLDYSELNGKIYAATHGRGVYESSVLTSVSESRAKSDGPALMQNFPNPFNPITTIRYAISKEAKVTLKIYNVLGQEVKTLVDEIQTSGHQAIQWDSRNNIGNSVDSGVYFYRMQVAGFVQTKKLLLLR